MKKMKHKFPIILSLIVVTLVGMVIAFRLWNVYQPISLSYRQVVDPLGNKEVKGEPKTISKENYSIKFIIDSTDGVLDQNKELYYLPETTQCNGLSLFMFCTVKKQWDISSPDIKAREIYLKTSFNETSTYQSEKKQVIEKSYYKKKKPLISKTLFKYESLLFVYNHHAEFTYILFDDDNKDIIYISFEEINFYDNLVFNDEYKPTKRLCDSDLSKKDYKSHYFDCTIY